ncbi:MAG: proton-conducting transporter membrane subunit [Spirochaetia bacterium]|jgi:multicomponent Na+:H+ antiporter subunit D|nr:proton-conducting transporter membrane subunit [Spirochaetia bacterium]
MNTISIPLLIVIPLGTAFLIPLIARKKRFIADILGSAATLALLVLSILLFRYQGVYSIGGWEPPIGISWVQDGFSNLMLVIVSLISFCATLFSVQYMERYTSKHKYYSLFLLMVTGMNGVILTGDMFNLFVFLEIAAVASYALVAFGGEHEELEASFKYLVLGSVGSSFILLGIALLYGMTGYLNMAAIANNLPDSNTMLLMLATVFFIVGFGIKAALVPFHAWLPDAHPSAPAPISAMLSGVLIKALGIYALTRILFNVIGVSKLYGGVLITLGTLSMVIGVFLAVGQWDFKRLLAYHSISQMGYVVLGLGIGGYILASDGNIHAGTLAILGGLFHLTNHSVFKSLLFLCSGSIEYSTGTRELKEMGGLGTRMPVTRATCTIASLSIAGVPPFNGFWSKLLIVIAAIQGGYHWLAVITILVSFVTLISFLKVLRYTFLGELPEFLKQIKESPKSMLAPLIILAILCMGMGLLLIPGIKEVILDPASAVLIKGAQYAQDALVLH